MIKQYKVYLCLACIWIGLAIFPCFVLLTDAQVFPWLNLSSGLSQFLFGLTSTGTSPYAVATVLVFFLISFKYMNKQHWKKMVLAMTFSLLVSFTVNHGLKSYFEEPRPNIAWLSQQTGSPIDLGTFYQQETQYRQENMAVALQQYRDESYPQQLNTIPSMLVAEDLQEHWIHEVGYAFPSGHTTFALTLVLTASYYLILSGAMVLNSLIVLWGLGMGTSRMLLGMHWPQDVVASTCLAAIISVLSIILIEKCCTQRHRDT